VALSASANSDNLFDTSTFFWSATGFGLRGMEVHIMLRDIRFACLAHADCGGSLFSNKKFPSAIVVTRILL
jgi:hypothetical protein